MNKLISFWFPENRSLKFVILNEAPINLSRAIKSGKRIGVKCFISGGRIFQPNTVLRYFFSKTVYLACFWSGFSMTNKALHVSFWIPMFFIGKKNLQIQVYININRLPPATNTSGQAVVKNTPRNDRIFLFSVFLST